MSAPASFALLESIARRKIILREGLLVRYQNIPARLPADFVRGPWKKIDGLIKALCKPVWRSSTDRDFSWIMIFVRSGATL